MWLAASQPRLSQRPPSLLQCSKENHKICFEGDRPGPGRKLSGAAAAWDPSLTGGRGGSSAPGGSPALTPSSARTGRGSGGGSGAGHRSGRCGLARAGVVPLPGLALPKISEGRASLRGFIRHRLKRRRHRLRSVPSQPWCECPSLLSQTPCPAARGTLFSCMRLYGLA